MNRFYDDLTLSNPLDADITDGQPPKVLAAAFLLADGVGITWIEPSPGPIDIPKYETKSGLLVGMAVDPAEIQVALDLEGTVWQERGFDDASYEDYARLVPHSRFFVAYDVGNQERPIAMNRLFAGTPLPPFVKKFPIYSDSAKLDIYEDCLDGKVEEFGTVAVARGRRELKAFLELSRLSYRDARSRGIEAWGTIMEPERVRQMNLLGFTFKQIGPTIEYQGGQCAAHIMHFAEVEKHMSATRPELYQWFIHEHLEA